MYIAASKSGALYTGMTNSLFRRMWQHKAKDLSEDWYDEIDASKPPIPKW